MPAASTKASDSVEQRRVLIEPGRRHSSNADHRPSISPARQQTEGGSTMEIVCIQWGLCRGGSGGVLLCIPSYFIVQARWSRLLRMACWKITPQARASSLSCIPADQVRRYLRFSPSYIHWIASHPSRPSPVAREAASSSTRLATILTYSLLHLAFSSSQPSHHPPFLYHHPYSCPSPFTRRPRPRGSRYRYSTIPLPLSLSTNAIDAAPSSIA